MCIAFNADIRCISAIAAADACAVITAAGNDITTGDGNVGSVGSVTGSTTANASTIIETACQQLAIIVHIVLDGQGAVAVFVRFFYTGVF